MKKTLWRWIAAIVTQPAVARWLIARAQRTPYTHIHGPDGSLYMGRWWLFNPYPPNGGANRRAAWRQRLPSVRIHHICRPDSDRHRHSHPWVAARTIPLLGWYIEELADGSERVRRAGDTGLLLHEDFHRIDRVSHGGVWTLFITYQKAGTWYFDVDGERVEWRRYLEIEE